MKFSRMSGRLAALSGALLFAGSLPALAGMMAPPSISVISPSANQSITGKDIPVKVSVSNFKIECGSTGKTNAPMGEGHIHAMVDGMDMAHLTTLSCGDQFTISGQGLKPGKHMLTVVLANDAHAMNSMPVTVPFNYEAAGSKDLPVAMAGGKAEVSVVSPKNGATVGRHFNLQLAVQHFDLSCDLEGKPNVEGWGHIHVFVQQESSTSAGASAPMVAMMQTPEGMKMGQMLMQQTGMSQDQLKPMLTMAEPAMIGMPCTRTIPVDLSTWRSGPAKIVVQLANNDHMPTMGTAPVVLSVNVK